MVAVGVSAAMSVALLAGCDGDAESEASPSPTVTATPPKAEPAEADVRTVLEEMGATSIGIVETTGKGEAFLYGQMDDGSFVVVRQVRKGPTPGRPAGTAETGGRSVQLLRTNQFGIIARFRCGPAVTDVWVRVGDQTMSRDRARVVKTAGAYLAASGCS
jgi:hypothetical protein